MEKVVKAAQPSHWRLSLYLLFFLPLCERLELAAAQLTSNTSSTATDLEALEGIKKSFSSARLTSWNGSTFCTWFGVTCNTEGRVVQLRLLQQGLTGAIPPSLQNLTSLERLEFQENSISGTIPTFIGNFSNLIHLNLSQNLLSGSIPPFSIFSSLQYLDLHGNSLEGPIPTTFGNFNGLKVLDLSENTLSGPIPPLGSFSSLQYLGLHRNKLGGSIPNTFGNFSRIKHLDLGQNALSGSIPTSICALSSATLQFLSFASNNLSGSIPDAVDRCLSLTGLYLGGNKLTGNIPDSFETLVHLRTIDLSINNLTGTIPRLPNGLTTLTLKGNRLTGNVSKEAGHLPDSLTLLSLSRNRFGDEIPAEIGQLPNLTKLELNDNSFRGFIPDTWPQSSPLETLDLSDNNLSGIIPSSLPNLTNLTMLMLDRNSLSGSIPASIGNLSLLSTVNLAENHLTGEIPPQIVNLLRLTVFNVSWNDLSGIIPSWLYELDRWADVITDHNPKLQSSTASPKTPAATPVSLDISVDTGSNDEHAWTVKTIYIFDGLLALLDACGLYAYLKLARPEKEKVVPIYESSTEDAVSFDELRRLTNNFHEDSIIGRGARSIVYKGIVGGGQVAVKVLRMENAEKSRETLLRELQALGGVRHRNVLRILAVCSHVEIRALVLEYMPFSSLDRFLYKMVGKACLSWDTRFNILVGVAQGLVYLHREHQDPIIHCDLKPSNILLDSDFEPKVADFGISKYVHPDTSGDASISGLCGTIGYIPPEYAWSTLASTKGDVFSFGVVLLELLTARKPYEGWDVEEGQPGSLVELAASAYPDKVMTILDPNLVILELDGDLHQKEVRMVLKIGLMCTKVDPRNRPDMTDVLQMLTSIKSAGRRKYPRVDELAQLPTLWEFKDDPSRCMGLRRQTWSIGLQKGCLDSHVDFPERHHFILQAPRLSVVVTPSHWEVVVAGSDPVASGGSMPLNRFSPNGRCRTGGDNGMEDQQSKSPQKCGLFSHCTMCQALWVALMDSVDEELQPDR